VKIYEIKKPEPSPERLELNRVWEQYELAQELNSNLISEWL